MIADFDNIPEPTMQPEVQSPPVNIPKNTTEQNATVNNSEGRVASLLRRSREVVSQRESFRNSNSLERTNTGGHSQVCVHF